MPETYIHTSASGHVFALGARPRPPDPKEWAYALAPASVDRSVPRSLARYFPPVLDQGAEGSCTAMSSVAVQMACASITGQMELYLSAEDLYYLERVKEGTFPADAGAYPADSFDCVLSNGGLPANDAWPYDASPGEGPPPGLDQQPKYLYISGHQPLAGADFIDGILTALDNRQPLICAFTFYESFYFDYERTAVLNPPSGQIAGGHQVAVVGWVPQYQLVWCRNSWGASSPARTDLAGEAVAGDIFLPASFFQDGTVTEVRAAVPAGVQPSPGPQPGPQTINFADYTWTGVKNG